MEMDKRTKVLIAVLGIGLVALLLFQFGVFNKPLSVRGGGIDNPANCASSIMSMSFVNYGNDMNDISDDIYLITMSGRVGGDCVYGYLNKAEVESATGYKTTYSEPIEIALDAQSVDAYYRLEISSSGELIKYDYSKLMDYYPGITLSSWVTCSVGGGLGNQWRGCSYKAKEAGYNNSKCVQKIGYTTCYGYGLKKQGDIYETENDRLESKMNVQIRLGDGTDEDFILDTSSDDNTQEKTIGKLVVDFEGFLQGQNLLPIAKPIFKGGGITHAVKPVLITPLLNYNPYTPCNFDDNWADLEDCMSTENSKIDIALTQIPSGFTDATFEGSFMKISTTDVYYPLVTMKVKAAWLGIYEPVAEPDLFNCQSIYTDYRINKEAMASYNIKIEEGTGDQGTFNIYASCNGFDVVPNPLTQNLMSGDVKTGEIRVIQQLNENSDNTCTITARQIVLGHTYEDTCTFIAHGSSACAIETESCSETDCCQGLICEEGYCSAHGVEICWNLLDDDGDGKTDCNDLDCKGTIWCPSTEICNNGIDDDGDGLIDLLDPDCQSNITECKNCFSWLIKVFEPNYCTEKVLAEKEWWNPVTWFYPDEGITQKQICPWLLGFMGLAILLVILIVFVLIKKMSGGGMRMPRMPRVGFRKSTRPTKWEFGRPNFSVSRAPSWRR